MIFYDTLAGLKYIIMKKTTLHYAKKILTIFFCLLISNSYLAQNITVSGALVGNGSYPDLNSAFTAINGGAQTGATINISVVANTTETLSAVLNAGAWASIVIQPSGGSVRIITGGLATPIIDLNGANNVTINGLNTGGNALTISNTNTGIVSTVRFIGAASNNIINNCTILGSSTDANTGTILFSTATTGGNSNNLITNCNIGPAGTNLPANGIVSIGTAANENANNTIQNCNIFDFFSATLVTNGILVGANNTAWTISGNRIYQTGLRTYTTANTHQGIRVASGNNHNVTNNRIGYASNAATGNYALTGTIATRFIAIDLAVATASASSVQGNTVSAITLTTASTAGTANGVICGINVTSGNVNISNNLVGGTSGVDLITSNQTATGGLVVGINSSTTGTVNISGNYIGGLTSTGTTAALTGAVTGVNISGIATGLSINTNTIGNPTPNSMRSGIFGLTTGASSGSGINVVSTLTATNISITANLIQNISSWSNGTSTFVRGIWGSLTSSTGIFSINSNTITNLTSNNANITVGTGQIGTAGIVWATGTSCTISANYISNIANTGTATTHVIVTALANANGFNTVYSNNRIWNITNTSPGSTATGPPVACGLFIRSGTNGLTFQNNFISLGNGQSSNTSFVGVWGQHGSTPNPTVQVYHNTINIEGTVTSGALSSFGVLRADFSTTARLAPFDVRNNIITNNRTGGTGGHYAISNHFGVTTPVNTGWTANASNYNVLNTSNPANVGFWTAAQTFAGWKTISNSDANSYSGIAVNYVNSANDLHLNMGTTPTFIESGAQPIVGLTTDIDGQTRPGPAGSVNGGGFASDIGADEVDAAFIDATPPTITHTILPGTCSTSDRTLSANIIDFSGTNTGSLTPRIYYNKNGGSYVNSGGLLASGTPSNGAWNFTISSTALSGVTFSDVINYYFIAQDGAPSSNVTSSPSVGLIAVDVNSVTTPPSTTYSYVIASLTGTYTIGSIGNFSTITSAANAYNNSCLSGPITYILNDANYSTSETFPITFSNNIYANSTNSLLIIPASANNVTITGASNSILGFIGADYIKLDGSNNGSSSRNITIENLTATLSTVAYIGNKSLTDAASNITINNCIITGSTGPTTTGGIILGSGVVLGGASEIPNNHMVIRGNHFMKVQNGVFAIGNATTPDLNWDISNNICGSTVDAEKLGFRGIAVQNASLFTISSNTVLGVKNSVTANNLCGMLIGASAASGTVTHNLLSAINNTNTTATTGANGITLSSTLLNNNILVSNNMISNVTGYGSTGVTINSNGNGIIITAGSGYKIYHNTIWLNTEQGNTALTSIPAAMLITTGVTAAGAIDLRNNIFVNTQTLTTDRYALYSAQSNSIIFSNIDYNIYSTSGPNLGFIGSARVDLAAMQTGFGSNLNSTTVAPVFVSPTNLHLNTTSNNAIDDLGTPLGITVDIDNQSRSNTLPDIGADEFNGTGCLSVNAGTASVTSYSICDGQSISISALGGSSGSGIIQKWRSATTAGGPYTDVTTGTGLNTPFFNTGTLTSGTKYYVLTKTCTSASLTASSNEVTVSVLSYPTPSITTSHTLACQGTTITLSALGANNYTWSAGNATTTNLQIAPTANTTYTLTGDVGGCKSATTINILYSPNPTITASSASNFVCLNNNQATLSATGANTYTWTDGNNNFVGSMVNPSPTVSTTYSVIGTNTNGCNSAEVTQTISVNAPTVNVSGNVLLCPGQTTTLTASGTAISYSWNTGANTSTISASPSGNTVYIVTGTDSQGCQLIVTQSVSVGNVSVSITGPSTVCTGNQINLTAIGAITYTWNSGAQTSTIAPSPTITTTYSVVGASGSCSNSAVTTITVNPFPTLTISGNSVICNGQSTSLSVTGANTYSWNTNSTSTAITVSPASNTVYSVGGNSLGCITNATFAVTTNSLPIIAIAQSANSVCVSSPVSFTASGANTYTWAGGPSIPNYTVNPTTASIYTVTGTSSQNCVSTNTVAVGSYSLPILAITPASATTCIGNLVTFTASGATTYTWNASPTETATTFSNAPGASITHTVAGTNANGCVGSTTVALLANALPTLAITPTSITLCAQTVATFTASGAATYTWNGNTQGSTPNFLHLTSTTHTVIGTNSLGCVSSETVGVVALPLPTISITPSVTSVCELSSASFTASGATTYTWSNSNTTSVVVITPTANTSFSVIGFDSNGCSSAANAVVLTNTLPIILVSSNSATICPSNSVSLNASGASTYSWTNIGSGSLIIVTPTVTTTYTVTGTNLSSNCSSSKTITVMSHTPPVISISPSSPSICLNSTVTLTASGINTYTWSNTLKDPTITVSPFANETYTVEGFSLQGCKATKTIEVLVYSLPTITVLPNNVETICLGASASFTVSGGVSYAWNPNVSSNNTFSASPTSISIYSVEASDIKGCKKMEIITIQVLPCLGLNETLEENNFIHVYPNPSSGIFNLDVYSEANIIITNVLGAMVYSDRFEAGKQLINLQDKSKGVYFMKVIVGKQQQTLRVIIE